MLLYAIIFFIHWLWVISTIFIWHILSLLSSYLYIDINNSNDILYCQISLLLYHYDWCHLRHHAQAIFSENFQARHSPTKSPWQSRYLWQPGVPSGTQKWDGLGMFRAQNRVEWLERSLKIKMCIFCPISFNKFKMWGLKTWVSPRKTCRKGRLRVLVGIMSRRRTENVRCTSWKKKRIKGGCNLWKNLCFERLELLPCLHSRFV